MHWRYLEDVAKLASHESGGLKIEKHLLVRRPSPTGPRTEPLAGPLRPGDELVTRLVVTSARELEFVHLKDERGSGTEPANALSGYRWGEGVGYYEVTRDAATHFFIDRLPKGVHVFEHSSRIQQAGVYQTGAATIRCMYAPEFMARSTSVRIESAREQPISDPVGRGGVVSGTKRQSDWPSYASLRLPRPLVRRTCPGVTLAKTDGGANGEGLMRVISSAKPFAPS